MQGKPISERISEIAGFLKEANGLGLAISDIAKKCELSKHRTREIMEEMQFRGLATKTAIEGSQFRYGMHLYFDPYEFQRISGILPNATTEYRLRQTTIFEFMGEVR